MNFKGIRVLLTEGGSRQALPMAKAFSELGCIVTTLNSTKLDVGYLSKYPTKKIIGICDRNDYLGTKNTIENLLKTGEYDIVVPLSDFTASLISENKEYFGKYAKIATNNWDVFNKAFDKLQTMEVCMYNGIPCPKTYFFESVDQVKIDNDDLRYPIVVKPRSACGSIGFNVAYSREQLKNILQQYNHQLGPMFIQEYIPQTGKQYNAHFFVDSLQNVKTALITEKNRWFPIDGGASTLSITVDRPDIVNICTKLLKEINWVGYCDIDLIEDPRDNLVKVIEINARISANIKICFVSGLNIAKQILQEYFGEEVIQYSDYKSGIRLRCLHTDFLWFIKSKNRFTCTPAWISFSNTYDQIFDIKDPIPWFGFTLQSIAKYRREMYKRKRIVE